MDWDVRPGRKEAEVDVKGPRPRVDVGLFVLKCRVTSEAIAVVGPVTASEVHEAIGGLEARHEGFELLDKAPCRRNGRAERERHPLANVSVFVTGDA